MIVPNPIVLRNVGDEIIGAGRIGALIWTGATASGDTVQLNYGNFWEGRTDTTQTYMGISFAPYGIPIPDRRLTLTQISAGKVFVYILEQ